MKPYVISACITLVIMTLISFGIPDATQAHGTRIAGCIGFFVILAMMIYNIDSWSLRKRTIVHTLTLLITVLPCLAISGWFDITNWQGIGLMLLTYAGFGIIGWTVGFVVNTVKVGTKK